MWVKRSCCCNVCIPLAMLQKFPSTPQLLWSRESSSVLSDRVWIDVDRIVREDLDSESVRVQRL